MVLQKPGLFATITRLGPLIRQVYAEDENICQQRAAELLGGDWKEKIGTTRGDRASAVAIQKKLTDYTTQEIFDTIYVSAEARARSRAKDKLKPYVNLAFANALLKDDFITHVVMSRLEAEDEALQAAALPPAVDVEEVRKSKIDRLLRILNESKHLSGFQVHGFLFRSEG